MTGAPYAESPQWYAVWTRSRHEKIVRQQLAQKTIDVFLPMVSRAINRHNDSRSQANISKYGS
jgi:hypothetical protein